MVKLLSLFRRRRKIFDIGAHRGEDTAFYLAKGFKVVAVEADPRLAEGLLTRFAPEIAQGDLLVLNVGVWSEAKTIPFYRNLYHDDWSSFVEAYGCRNGTPYEIVNVECVRIEDLFDRYGVPYYLKIDVEGADRLILSALRAVRKKPKLISVEEYGPAAVDDLAAAGYGWFAISPQNRKTPPVAVNPAREGNYVHRQFSGIDSGAFGAELDAVWMQREECKKALTERLTPAAREASGEQDEWYDIHAATNLTAARLRKISKP